MAPASRVASLLVLALALELGCTRDTSRAQNDALTVFAASSTTEAFQELARAFEARRPDIKVRLAFAGSQALRLQLEQGAPADVYASANGEHINALVDQGLLSGVRPFATNELAVIVSADVPVPIESFADLLRAERIVVGTPNVPIGAYTRTLFDNVARDMGPAFAAQLRDRVVSEENNVRLVRAKVELGEADAAIVYLTDALGSKRTRIITVPDPLNVPAQYHAGRVTDSVQPEVAEEWLGFLESDEAQRILRNHGFRSN